MAHEYHRAFLYVSLTRSSHKAMPSFGREKALSYTNLEVEENIDNKKASLFLLHNLVGRVREAQESQFESLRSVSLHEIGIEQGKS